MQLRTSNEPVNGEENFMYETWVQLPRRSRMMEFKCLWREVSWMIVAWREDEEEMEYCYLSSQQHQTLLKRCDVYYNEYFFQCLSLHSHLSCTFAIITTRDNILSMSWKSKMLWMQFCTSMINLAIQFTSFLQNSNSRNTSEECIERMKKRVELGDAVANY